MLNHLLDPDDNTGDVEAYERISDEVHGENTPLTEMMEYLWGADDGEGDMALDILADLDMAKSEDVATRFKERTKTIRVSYYEQRVTDLWEEYQERN